MRVNVEHVNEVIELIRDEANFFALSVYEVPSNVLGAKDIDEKIDMVVGNPKSYAAQQVRKYNPVCSTPACVAGWANFARKRANPNGFISLSSRACAADYLGIGNTRVADMLFGISISPEQREGVTREEAIYALERLRDTGKVPSYRSIRTILKRRHAEEQSKLHGPQGSSEDRAPDSSNG